MRRKELSCNSILSCSGARSRSTATATPGRSAQKTVGYPERFAQEALARTPKSKSSAAQLHGERTPLACGFQRLAENLVPQTFSRQIDKECETKVWASRPNRHAGGVLPIPISEFGLGTTASGASCLRETRPNENPVTGRLRAAGCREDQTGGVNTAGTGEPLDGSKHNYTLIFAAQFRPGSRPAQRQRSATFGIRFLFAKFIFLS